MQVNKAAAFLATEVSYRITGFCRASGLPTKLQVSLYFLGEGARDLSQPFPLPPTPNHTFRFQSLKKQAFITSLPMLKGFAHRTALTCNGSLEFDHCKQGMAISISINYITKLEKGYRKVLRFYTVSPKRREEVKEQEG